jgi:hypothetical protein
MNAASRGTPSAMLSWASLSVRGEREPMVAMAQGFGVAFLRVELARHGEALSRRFVEGNAIAGYVGKEGTAARELVIYVHQGMDDEIDRR